MRCAALAAVLVGAAVGAQDGGKPRSNLVAIVTDDQGRWAVGAYGNAEVHTPAMDALAAQGAKFTSAFVATPVCSPSRATYLTGRHASEVGITDWISPEEAAEGLGLSGETWPQVLQRNGYATALIGKWHLGDRPEFHPRRLGFDHFTGFLGGGNRPMDPTLEVGGELRKLKGPLPDLLVDDAIAWVGEQKDRPFCLCLHFRAPHLPYLPVPDEDTEHFADLVPTIPDFRGLDRQKVARSTKNYYASIASIDRNVGRLLAAMDRLGLTENTIVLFTSDHGYNEGRHGINTKGNGHWIVGGRSGPKRPNMWDTSMAVPLLVRWPGVVAPGTVIEGAVSQVDVFRTVLGMLEVPVPEECRARGADFSPLLRGEGALGRDAVFGQYDLHNNGLAYLRMVRTERYKFVKHFRARMMDEVYDLVADPDEKRNLWRKWRRTEDGQARLAELEARLRAWMTSIDDPLLR